MQIHALTSRAFPAVDVFVSASEEEQTTDLFASVDRETG
jgi:hypothetical protein